VSQKLNVPQRITMANVAWIITFLLLMILWTWLSPSIFGRPWFDLPFHYSGGSSALIGGIVWIVIFVASRNVEV
jgi:hypothetical protein